MQTQDHEIGTDSAQREHGITAPHHEMPNGERRFRLRKNDGTGYVRTEAGTTGGWQQSHCHTKATETHIVQRGWMGYAELINSKPRVELHYTGDSITVPPGVVHNIFLPANAVLHTVQHGDTAFDHRETVDGAIAQLDAWTRGLGEHGLVANAVTPSAGYSPEYRHFDTLIWQVPAWSTALFLVTISGMCAIGNSDFLRNVVRVPPASFVSWFLGVMALVLFAMSHALFRFRQHQWGLKRLPRVNIVASASFYLQLAVTAEAFVLAYAVLVVRQAQKYLQAWGLLGLVASLFVAIAIHREWWLRADYRRHQKAARNGDAEPAISRASEGTIEKQPKVAAEALFREFTYLTDLIKMYRSLQLQALAVSITLYSAALALVGAALGKEVTGKPLSSELQFVASYVTVFLPYFGGLVLLGYGTMEIRIRRASRFIQHELGELASSLTGEPRSDSKLLRYEDNPSRHLSKPEIWLSTSTAFVLLMGAPAIAAGWWHTWYAPQDLPGVTTHPGWSLGGLVFCVLALIISGGVSVVHELRLPPRARSNEGGKANQQPS